MKVIIGKDIRVEQFSYELLLWCQDHLVLDNPEFHIAENAGRWTGNIEKELILYEKRGDALVLPFGVVKDVWHLIKHAELVLKFAPNLPSKLTGSIPLYSYQKDARNELLMAKNGILQAPCGSGKTQIGLAVIQALGLKALWLTHTGDLLKQSMDRALEYFDGDFGTITGGKVNIGADITFATVQTMAKLDLPSYADEFSVVIVDECHKVAGTPTRVMQFYRVLTNLNARYKFGLSATVHRADGLIKSTFAVLGNLVHTISSREVGDKIIKCDHVQIDTAVEESEDYLETDGTLQHGRLISYLIAHENRNMQMIDIILQKNAKNILLLSHRVSHLRTLKKSLPHAFVVTGAMPKNKRAEIFDTIRNGNGGHVLLSTYSLAKEGLDIPNLDALIFGTPVGNKSIVLQSVGRIERNIDGKEQPIVYDLIDRNIGYCVKLSRKRKNVLRKR